MLAKYYCAWNEIPYLVKLGGEKIFRYFIEAISPKQENSSSIQIDRDFYESTIAKIILFKELEKIYGVGANSMGQLRSAVIPYTLAILYVNTDGAGNGIRFDLQEFGRGKDLKRI